RRTQTPGARGETVMQGGSDSSGTNGGNGSKGPIIRDILTRKRMMVFSGTSHPALSEEIARHLDISLSPVEIRRFASGEIYCRFDDSVRGADAFVIQTHTEPINEAIFEQLVMIDALKRASAKRITAVVPYYGYARQDHKAMSREPISAKLVADLLTVAGADRVVSVDLHSGQIQGFFDFPVDHLTAVPLLAGHVATAVEGDVTVVSPDAGGAQLAREFANQFAEAGIDADLAIIDKRRPKGTANTVEALEVVGDVEGRCCVLVDDMIDTAGTIVGAANLLADRGALDVRVAATHPVLSGSAVDRLKNA